jgi:hypothetical protein
MVTETIKARARTTHDGKLNLSMDLGLTDTDVAVVVQVTAISPPDYGQKDGWPAGFFEQVAGSMPDLERVTQGEFEQRPSLG